MYIKTTYSVPKYLRFAFQENAALSRATIYRVSMQNGSKCFALVIKLSALNGYIIINRHYLFFFVFFCLLYWVPYLLMCVYVSMHA